MANALPVLPAQRPTESGGGLGGKTPAHRVPGGLASLGTLLCAQRPTASLAPAVSSQRHRGSRGVGGGPAENTAGPWTLHPHIQRAPATPVTLDHRWVLYKVEGLLGNPTHRHTPNQQVVCARSRSRWHSSRPGLLPCAPTQHQGGFGWHPAPRWPWLALPRQCSSLLAASIIFLKESSGHSESHQPPTLTAH